MEGRIDNFTIIGEIGRGGMGVVYKARDESLERTVALKILPDHLTGDTDFAERFHREAKMIARLNHPHIVTIHSVAVSDNVHYFAMEYIERGSLKELLEKEGPRPVEKALTLTLQAAEGLAHAHREGIVHRDLKPSNLLQSFHPGSANLGLGVCYFNKGDYDSAADYFLQCLETAPEARWQFALRANLFLAEIHRDEGDYASALEYFKSTIDSIPGHIQDRYIFPEVPVGLEDRGYTTSQSLVKVILEKMLAIQSASDEKK